MNLLFSYTSSFFARYFSKQLTTFEFFVRPNKLFALLTIITLSLISGLRKNIGDTFYYMHSYATNNYTWQNVFSSKDYGFGIYQMILQYFSKDPQLLILVTAIITNVLIVITFYKYSRLFEIAIYIYITSGLFVTSMNGIRQFLASSITFIGLKYIINGSFFKYLFLVLLASFIHQSAFILIPIYFIVRSKAWTKMTFLFLSLAIVIVIGFNQLSGLLFSALSDTNYASYQQVTHGANVIRVAVAIVPIIIAYFGREKLRELWPQSDVVVNFSIISLVFSIIATQNWIFDRMNIYFSLYGVILISWIIKLFKERNQNLIYFCLITCYFCYHFYEDVISFGGLQYLSDYL